METSTLTRRPLPRKRDVRRRDAVPAPATIDLVLALVKTGVVVCLSRVPSPGLQRALAGVVRWGWPGFRCA